MGFPLGLYIAMTEAVAPTTENEDKFINNLIEFLEEEKKHHPTVLISNLIDALYSCPEKILRR